MKIFSDKHPDSNNLSIDNSVLMNPTRMKEMALVNALSEYWMMDVKIAELCRECGATYVEENISITGVCVWQCPTLAWSAEECGCFVMRRG